MSNWNLQRTFYKIPLRPHLYSDLHGLRWGLGSSTLIKLPRWPECTAEAENYISKHLLLKVGSLDLRQQRLAWESDGISESQVPTQNSWIRISILVTSQGDLRYMKIWEVLFQSRAKCWGTEDRNEREISLSDWTVMRSKQKTIDEQVVPLVWIAKMSSCID